MCIGRMVDVGVSMVGMKRAAALKPLEGAVAFMVVGGGENTQRPRILNGPAFLVKPWIER